MDAGSLRQCHAPKPLHLLMQRIQHDSAMQQLQRLCSALEHPAVWNALALGSRRFTACKTSYSTGSASCFKQLCSRLPVARHFVQSHSSAAHVSQQGCLQGITSSPKCWASSSAYTSSTVPSFGAKQRSGIRPYGSLVRSSRLFTRCDQPQPWHAAQAPAACRQVHSTAPARAAGLQQWGPQCSMLSTAGASTAAWRAWHAARRRSLHSMSLKDCSQAARWHTWHAGPVTFPSWWPAWEAVYRSSVKWLPSVPGARAAARDVLSALNVAGAGGAVLSSLLFAVVEVMAATRASAEQGFTMMLPSHLAAVTAVDTAPRDNKSKLIASCKSVIEGIHNVLRALWLALVFTPVVLSAPLALHFNLYRAEWMELLRRSLEVGGPAFIKWGQWAATRHDLFPPDMCSELEHLHSQAPAHHFRHTQRALRESLGMSHAELFDWIEHTPVASGSIGQIHRARLSEKGAALTGFEAGQLVAVKIRHPGVETTILRDFSTMLALASIAAKIPSLSHLRLEDTLKQFAAPLKEQVDLAREAANLQRFNYNFRHTSSVQFPVPLYPLVSSEVLVETYEEGDHISRYIVAENNPYNRRLSIIGSGTMLQMMLLDNLIHSDLHPGNILVRLMPPGGLLGLVYAGLDKVKRSSNVSNVTRARLDVLQQRWLQPQMVLLDVGMATELSEEDQRCMVGLFRSFAAMDGRECGKWTLRFSGPEQQCPDPEAFIAAMANTFEQLKRMDEEESGWGSTEFRNSADTLAHVLELVRQYQVTLPGHICAVVVTTLVLEGWSNKLDPTHSVLTQVQKMFEAQNSPWRQRLITAVEHVMQEDPDQLVTLSV